ncbi:MAG: sporulation protein [Chitinophagaceae bacterium]
MKSLLPFLLFFLPGCNNTSTNDKKEGSSSAPAVITKSDTVFNSPKAYSNQRFRNVTVQKIADNQFRVQGEAQIFEAMFSWVVEDGHHELKKGNQMTDAGAPAWGKFHFTIAIPKTNANTTRTLILFESSAKDGSRQYELPIALD